LLEPRKGEIATVIASDEAQMKYEAPEIVDYGDLTALTAGAADGSYLDADFPVGTAKGHLGFSG
jgi:hypothetical protein